MKFVKKIEKEFQDVISSLLNTKIKINHPGDQGVGNTWQETLGVKISNKPKADWMEFIEIKCLTCKNHNLKNGSSLTLASKTPNWKLLNEFNITPTSFYNKIDYDYRQNGESLFFTKKLRYVVAPSSRSIDWYVVKLKYPTEPYSKAPARSGDPIFSWKIEEIFGKIEKLSVTLVYKQGEYPTGYIVPLRSYIIDMTSEKILDLLADGSIRYEIRYGPTKESSLYEKIKKDGRKDFPSTDSFEFWNWVENEFKKQGGRLKDYGTGFRLNRKILNSLLDLKGEIVKYE